jgi:hypothetical protein
MGLDRRIELKAGIGEAADEVKDQQDRGCGAND